MHFAPFADGSLLVTGTAAQGKQVGTFSALFSRAGVFVADIKVADDVAGISLSGAPISIPDDGDSRPAMAEPPKPNKLSPVSAIINGFATSARGGNAYMLRATDPPRLYAISPAGEVVRQFQIHPRARFEPNSDSPSRN